MFLTTVRKIYPCGFNTQRLSITWSYTFTLEDGRKVKGADVVKIDRWAWKSSLHAPGCRYVRLRARSRTYGQIADPTRGGR